MAASETPAPRATQRPRIADGWRATPMAVKAIIVLWSVNHLAGALLFVLGVEIAGVGFPQLSSDLDLLIRVGVVALSLIMLYALVATVTDAFGAPAELRTQKVRSLAIGVVLFALIAMFFAATIVRMGGNVLNRSL